MADVATDRTLLDAVTCQGDPFALDASSADVDVDKDNLGKVASSSFALVAVPDAFAAVLDAFDRGTAEAFPMPTEEHCLTHVDAALNNRLGSSFSFPSYHHE